MNEQDKVKMEILKQSYRIALIIMIARVITVLLIVCCIGTAVIYFENPWLLAWLGIPALMTPRVCMNDMDNKPEWDNREEK